MTPRWIAGAAALAAWCSAACATTAPGASATTTRPSARSSAAPSPARAARVVFDTPGSTPRPLKEVTAPITGSPTSLEMDISQVTYPGAVCGFSFRGQRPASPVTIRMWGTVAGTAFDSGELTVAWEPAGRASTEAGSSSDRRSGWSFLSDAVPNRNGPGWVVQVAGVPQAKSLPSTMRCRITGTRAFRSANGPVGHWAGFATV